MNVSSIFAEGHELRERKFRMGLDKDIIVDESCARSLKARRAAPLRLPELSR
jgi:hypothetical protein